MSKFITLNVTSGNDIGFTYFNVDHITRFYGNDQHSTILLTDHVILHVSETIDDVKTKIFDAVEDTEPKDGKKKKENGK